MQTAGWVALLLGVGAVLIYEANQATPAAAHGTTAPPATHPSTHHSTSSKPLAPPEPTLTVQAGYTLSAIAQKVYGDAGLWPALYLANLSVIGKNPNLIQPGMVLHIPPLADARVLAQVWYTHARPAASPATNAQAALRHLLVVPNPVSFEG